MQKAVEIESKGLILRGTLHIPENITADIPIVCIFHGFTGDKIGSHFIFVKLSRILAERGIASVRFDFGGSGESDGDFVDMTVSRELDDANAILDYAKSLDFVDKNRIGILGLSLGGAVASMLAGDRKEDIQSLCLWAPAGNIREIVMNREKNEKEDLKKMLRNGFRDMGGLMLGIDFLKDTENINVFERAVNYDKNVLLIHGDNDEIIKHSVSEKYLDIYGDKAVLYTVNGADHTFNSINWENEVIDCTSNFLEKELK
ncbi:alpha/beta hydrolase [Clostridium sp. MT-14]|uniref:Alpha/beta hydrolase n=1 Tax=Clostridium aromativorans TaxID=2836848 RepID=A0ABS8N8R8_9CLOT|nr:MULTISPECIES: alpha/beta fold hydrolase [Clostridium]KAA8669434.1 alpha/beta hydrolase [Clostridium sp. HV4-5-A1G]MCC9296205.1 alpha/beta hydrolase [Clostridium aromativorans]CAB1244667.1 Fermentation/respiration switch protein [Clostridiaceae bacterium BL-3]